MTLFAKLSSSKKHLKLLVETMEKKGLDYIDFDIAINDEIREFQGSKGTIQQNSSMWVSQTKEVQAAKTPKFFVANGRANYTDGKITVITKDGVKTGNIVYEEKFDSFDTTITGSAKPVAKQAKTPVDEGLPF